MEKRRPAGARRRKVCQFCADKSQLIDYKDVEKDGFCTNRVGVIATGHCNFNCIKN